MSARRTHDTHSRALAERARCPAHVVTVGNHRATTVSCGLIRENAVLERHRGAPVGSIGAVGVGLCSPPKHVNIFNVLLSGQIMVVRFYVGSFPDIDQSKAIAKFRNAVTTRAKVNKPGSSLYPLIYEIEDDVLDELEGIRAKNQDQSVRVGRSQGRLISLTACRALAGNVRSPRKSLRIKNPLLRWGPK